MHRGPVSGHLHPSSATRGCVARRALLATVVLAALAGWPGGWASGASAGVVVAPDPVPVAMGGVTPVTVRWTGQAPRRVIFIRICDVSVSSPGFDEALDCSLLSEVTPNGTADGSGSATVQVFRGPEPGGDNAWGCFARGDVPPAGIRAATTCYVRVTNDVVSNGRDDAEAAFTIVPGPGSADAPAAAGAQVAGAQVAGGSPAGTSTPSGVPASIGLTG